MHKKRVEIKKDLKTGDLKVVFCDTVVLYHVRDTDNHKHGKINKYLEQKFPSEELI